MIVGCDAAKNYMLLEIYKWLDCNNGEVAMNCKSLLLYKFYEQPDT